MNDNDIEIIDVDTNNNPELNNNVVDESNNMDNKPKKSKKKLILIILSLLIIAAGAFVYLEKDVLFGKSGNTNNANSNGNNANNAVESKEEEINDQDLKRKISYKVYYMIPTKEVGSIFWSYTFYDSAVNKEIVLSDADKLRLILTRLDPDETKFDFDQINSSKFKEQYKNEIDSGIMGSKVEIYKIPLSKIDEDYLYLFGKTISNYEDEFEGCQHYYYDSVNKFYFFVMSCGTGIDHGTKTYINKITQKDNEIYVYISVEYYEYDDSANKILVYSDHNKTNVVQEEEINSSNYDKFSEYKLTFTKEGNDFYYKSLIRTK